MENLIFMGHNFIYVKDRLKFGGDCYDGNDGRC